MSINIPSVNDMNGDQPFKPSLRRGVYKIMNIIIFHLSTVFAA